MIVGNRAGDFSEILIHAVVRITLKAARVLSRFEVLHYSPLCSGWNSRFLLSCLHMSEYESQHGSRVGLCVWLSQQEQGMKSPSDVSNQWGSYFVDVHGSGGGDEESQKLTWCCHCIHKYSTMAIPSVEHIAGMYSSRSFDGDRRAKNNKAQIIITVIIIIRTRL